MLFIGVLREGRPGDFCESFEKMEPEEKTPTNRLIGRDSEKPLENSREWVDVTDFINAATVDLKIGDMIHSESFQIDRVMSAIEIMDPKMDTGLKYDERKVESVEERIKNRTLPMKIKPLHCIEIMDRLLCTEATWYNGRFLTQTVFTCMYVHVTEQVDFPYLRTYLKLFLKCCEHIHRLMEELTIRQFSVKEDEEFYPRTYENNIFYDFDIPKTIEDCTKFENVLKRRIDQIKEKTKKKKGKKKKQEEEEEEEESDQVNSREAHGEDAGPPFQCDPKEELFLCEALFYRLRYRRLYLQIHFVLSEERDIDRIQSLIPECLSLLKKIRTQHRKNKKIKSEDVLGFDPEYTRLIHGVIPQKPHPLLEFKVSCELLDNYLSALNRIPDLDDCRTIYDFLRFFQYFSMFKPNVVARSYCNFYFKRSNVAPSTQSTNKKLDPIKNDDDENSKNTNKTTEEDEKHENQSEMKSVTNIHPPPPKNDIILQESQKEEEEDEGEYNEDGESDFDRKQLLCMNNKLHLSKLVERSFFLTYHLIPPSDISLLKKKRNEYFERDDDDDEEEDNENDNNNNKSIKEEIVEKLMEVKEVRLLCHQVGICFSIYFYYYLYNRPKASKKLKKLFTEHLKKVLFNASVVDHSLTLIVRAGTGRQGKHYRWFYQYVFDLVLNCIRDVYMLQFELELYSPDEFAPMFAILDRIYTNLCSNVDLVKSAPELGVEIEKEEEEDDDDDDNIEEEEEEEEEIEGEKNMKKRNNNEEEEKMYRNEWEFKEKWYKLELLLSRAFFRMMIYLERAGHLVCPKYPFGKPEERYNARTRYFSKLTPNQRQFFSYEEYVEEKVQVMKTYPNLRLLLENVEKHFNAAETRNKQILQMKPMNKGVARCVTQMRKYFESLGKVLFANKLSINLMKKLKKGQKKMVVLDMVYGAYPVIKLKEPYKKKN